MRSIFSSRIYSELFWILVLIPIISFGLNSRYFVPHCYCISFSIYPTFARTGASKGEVWKRSGVDEVVESKKRYRRAFKTNSGFKQEFISGWDSKSSRGFQKKNMLEVEWLLRELSRLQMLTQPKMTRKSLLDIRKSGKPVLCNLRFCCVSLFNGDCKGAGPFAGVWGGAPKKKKEDRKIFLPVFRKESSQYFDISASDHGSAQHLQSVNP